jgi:hypothetical protein
MSSLRGFVPSALLVLLGLSGGCAAGGPPPAGTVPLTQDMLDDYCKYVEWCRPQALGKVGGPQRLRQLVANDWDNGDKTRQEAILAAIKWWREDFPRLRPAERQRLRQAPGADARLAQLDQQAVHRQILQQEHDARQLQLQALSNLQAKHHETMMSIIHNIRPSYRVEYNPATGRYDRYAP